MNLIVKILFINLFLLMLASFANAQTLFFEPDEIFLAVGESFPVKIFLDTENRVINVLSAQIQYDPSKIAISDINQGASAFPIVPIAPDILEMSQLISLTGAKPNGINSAKALVAQITIKALRTGNHKINFTDSATAYLNDGVGTEIPLKTKTLKINAGRKPIQPLVINSSTHPVQSQWYNVKNATVFWQLNPDSVYSYEVSSDYFKEPDNIPDKPIGLITLKNLPEGISYFHLKECTPQGNCGKKVSYRFQIDTVAPKYEVVFFDIEGQKFISILPKDENSGIKEIERFTFQEANFEAKLAGVIGAGIWQKASMPYPISQTLGETLIFRVTDNAGNFAIVKVPLVKKNYFMIGLFVSLMIVLIIILIIFTFRKILGPRKSQKYFVAVFLFFIINSIVFAQTTEQNTAQNSAWRILFEGKLTDTEGKAVPNGKYNVKFSIFDAPEQGNEVWEEIFEKDDRIEILNGNFQVMLGERKPINLNFNEKDYFLAVSIGGSTETPYWDEPMKPRRKIITLEKLLNPDSSLIFSPGELIDALIKEFELLDVDSSTKSSSAAFIEFLKNKLKAPDGSTIIVNLDTLQNILAKAAQFEVDKSKKLEASQPSSEGILDFFVRIINTLIQKIGLIFEKIGQIFSYLINISDKVDKIYDIVSKTPATNINQQGAALDSQISQFKPTQIFGKAKIEKATNMVFVEVPQINDSSKIFITFETPPPFVWWISQKIPGRGFSLATYPQTTTEVNFDWWLVNDLNFQEAPLPAPNTLPELEPFSKPSEHRDLPSEGSDNNSQGVASELQSQGDQNRQSEEPAPSF